MNGFASNTIALTGNPEAQAAVSLQLEALIRAAGHAISVRIGLTERAEAHGIHDAGGEVWHCGVEAPARNLVGVVDRALPAESFDGIALHVCTCLTEFTQKRRVGA